MKKITPKPGQESVWDYPRPPKLENTNKTLRVIYNDTVIAQTNQGMRILETSHPPTYYFPPEDVHLEYLELVENKTSFCEYKGAASYYNLRLEGRVVQNVAWFYANPLPKYQALKNHLCFYASKVSACYVNDELVQAQEGDFYGGWITSQIVGPFKGGANTWGW
ncbi:DUF427 domain-containing protein [uncultured Microscilla sp.]|uniref:DUF427 domain-containing protein n=1 Tax=uncultured Microscilla sp. TaxID=432653 RepID=UPI00262181AB|nr:DUF427 domain-containing protein [uncultured Microscilla sp.]